MYIQTRHPFLGFFSWDDAVVATISDASFCQAQEQFDGITQNFESQQACITALAPGKALNAEKMLIHPLSWSSTRIRRVCRRTLMAEVYALSNAVEHGLRKRATIVDMGRQPMSNIGCRISDSKENTTYVMDPVTRHAKFDDRRGSVTWIGKVEWSRRFGTRRRRESDALWLVSWGVLLEETARLWARPAPQHAKTLRAHPRQRRQLHQPRKVHRPTRR